jgi:hypothetical protein
MAFRMTLMRWLVFWWRLLSLTLERWFVFREWLVPVIKWGGRFVFRRRRGLVKWRFGFMFGRLMAVSY